MTQLQQHKVILSNELRSLKDGVERFYASKPYTRFLYTDPEDNFNRRKVHGVICDLISINDKTNCTAIETAAGGMVRYFLLLCSAENQRLK